MALHKQLGWNFDMNTSFADTAFNAALDARVQYEKYLITGNIEDEFWSGESVRESGYTAFSYGVQKNEVPALFNSVKFLRDSWVAGWSEAADVIYFDDSADDECSGVDDFQDYTIDPDFPFDQNLSASEPDDLEQDHSKHKHVHSVQAGSLVLEVYNTGDSCSWELVDCTGRTHHRRDSFKTAAQALYDGLTFAGCDDAEIEETDDDNSHCSHCSGITDYPCPEHG